MIRYDTIRYDTIRYDTIQYVITLYDDKSHTNDIFLPNRITLSLSYDWLTLPIWQLCIHVLMFT